MAVDRDNAQSSHLETCAHVCIAGASAGEAFQHDHPAFEQVLTKFYQEQEAKTLDGLVNLKRRARQSTEEEFWRIIAEGLAGIFDAQWGFISKRVERDELTGEELPPAGERGARLTGICWYYDDGKGVSGFGKNVMYHCWGNACSMMKHNKVFLVPGDYPDVFPSDPNAEFMPIPFEAYMAAPLFASGNAIGHFGLIWDKEGISRRKLSWGFIQAGLHSLEDMITQRLAELFSPDVSRSGSPTNALTRGAPVSSLRPYAQTLSHELRTPMQGVVGMLDLMHNNLQEFSETQMESRVRKVLKSLKDDIEVIQDSSRRAVEAAENVAHAYDLNMGVPPEPSVVSPAVTKPGDDESGPKITSHSSANLRFADTSSAASPRGTKRRFSGGSDSSLHPRKTPMLSKPLISYNERQRDLESAVHESEDLTKGPNFPGTPSSEDAVLAMQRESESALAAISNGGNGLQYSKIHELLDYIMNESLRVGGRPNSTIGTDKDNGKVIEATYVLPDGELRTKIIDCNVEPSVPETILVHEKNLAKLVSCVFQNALKFTDHGRVVVKVAVDPNLHVIVFNIMDTGRGIHPTFQSNIFKPFSKEDNSLSRGTEGLGLGLLVAKGLSRRLGGDLRLVRSETEGPNHGSEFEIRIPVFPSEVSSPTSDASRHSPERRDARESHPALTQSPRPTPSSQSNHPHRPLPPEAATPTASPRQKRAIIVEPPPRSTPSKTRGSSPPPNKFPERPSKNLAATHPLTFLVAEDNVINRRLLVSMLVKLGYDPLTQIYEAYDGADAVRQATEAHSRGFELGKGPIDIILMDLWMPSMDGYEATERILGLYGSLRKGMRRAISEPGALPKSDQDGLGATMIVGADLKDDPATIAGEKDERKMEGVEKPSEEKGEEEQMLPPTIMAITADATDRAAERAVKVGMDGVMAKPFKLRDLEKLVKDGWGKRVKMMTGLSASDFANDGAAGSRRGGTAVFAS